MSRSATQPGRHHHAAPCYHARTYAHPALHAAWAGRSEAAFRDENTSALCEPRRLHRFADPCSYSLARSARASRSLNPRLETGPAPSERPFSLTIDIAPATREMFIGSTSGSNGVSGHEQTRDTERAPPYARAGRRSVRWRSLARGALPPHRHRNGAIIRE